MSTGHYFMRYIIFQLLVIRTSTNRIASTQSTSNLFVMLRLCRFGNNFENMLLTIGVSTLGNLIWFVSISITFIFWRFQGYLCRTNVRIVSAPEIGIIVELPRINSNLIIFIITKSTIFTVVWSFFSFDDCASCSLWLLISSIVIFYLGSCVIHRYFKLLTYNTEQCCQAIRKIKTNFLTSIGLSLGCLETHSSNRSTPPEIRGYICFINYL